MTALPRQSTATSRSPLWKQVAASLRSRIVTRHLEPGQQMSTEVELAAEFGVSRFTIRRALSELEREGLVRIEHGRGMFVSDDIVPYALTQRTRFSDNLRRFNFSGERRYLGISLQNAPPEVAEQLALSPNAEVYRADLLLSVGGRPLSLARNYYPARRFCHFDALLRETQSSSEALRRYGVTDYTRKRSTIISRMPDLNEAHLLKIPRTRPVLEIHKVDVDPEDVPVAFGITCTAGDRVQIIVE